MEIVKAINNVLPYSARLSYNAHWVKDESVLNVPVTGTNTGVLYMPIYTEKGPTNVLKKFSGNGAYKELIDTYGNPDVKALGLPYTMAALHVQRGGDLITHSIKHSSATRACFIIGLKIEDKDEKSQPIKKTLGWILPDFSEFIEDPTAGETGNTVGPTPTHTPHTITTKRVSLVSIDVPKKIKTLDALAEYANTLFTKATDVSSGTGENFKVYPLIYGMYKGEGKYGNNYQFVLSDARTNIQGRPYFVGEFYDTRNTTYAPNTKRAFSMSKDTLGELGISINLQWNSGNSLFDVRSMDNYTLNAIGDILKKEMDKIELFQNVSNLSVQSKLLLEKKTENSGLMDPTINTELASNNKVHKLSYLNLATLEQLEPAFVVKKSNSFALSGGSEGLLEDMKTRGFSWDFEADVNAGISGASPKKVKIVAEMFREAFLGMRSAEIYNLWANDADYILDAGFPSSVKEAMVSLVETSRDEIQCILNAPINFSSVDEVIEWKKTNNYFSRLITYLPGNFEYTDKLSSESVRVPMTMELIPILIAHYGINEFKEPICGVDEGMFTMTNPGSGRGIGDLTLKSKDKLANAGYCVVSAYRDGQLFLDGQKSNYLLNEFSHLQYFPNNSIANRIIKTCYKVLERNRHKSTDDDSIKRITDEVNLALKPFLTKVASVNYYAMFASEYDKAVGILSHMIEIQFNGFINNHLINLIAKPVS